MIEKFPEEDEKFPGLHYPCRHPGHEVPGHIVIQPGRYRHTCEGCGRVVEFRVAPAGQIWP